MLKKFIVTFAILSVALAIAGNIPTLGSGFQVVLLAPSIVNGTELQPGEYRVTFGENKIIWAHGQILLETPAKIETADSKFDATSVYTIEKDSKQVVSEIHLKGSKTRIVLAR
jgi:hypothetical protein